MSAAPYITVRERAAETRTTQRSQTRRKLQVEESVPVRNRARKSTFGLSSMEFFASQAVTFAVLAAATFMLSVLVGNSMSEFERRKAVEAGARVKMASTDMVRLRQRFDRLNSSSEVGDWAMARGFVPAYGEGVGDGKISTD